MRRLFIIALILIAFGILSIFIFSPHLTNNGNIAAHVSVATSTPHVITLVSLQNSYRRGKHTIKGSLVMPTPCYTITANTSMVPSTTPPVIRLNLVVPIDTGRCLALTATTTFSTTQVAAKGAIIKAYINNTFATSTAL